MTAARPQIGFIGLGIMGGPMARNLLSAGYRVHAYNRTRARAETLERAGARTADSPADAAREADIVITMLTDSPDVVEVVTGPQGILEGARPGTVLIDMTTISPATTRQLAARLEAAGLEMLDAPVSGGDVGARAATLTIMVGGKREVFERCRPVLERLGRRVTYLGPHGAGQATKLCNQILCAVHMLALCEALSLAARSGLPLDAVHEVLKTGAGSSWALEQLGPKILAGDHAPAFMIDLIAKDLRLVMETAEELRLPLAGTALAAQYFRGNQAADEGRLGTQAMIRVLERLGSFQLAAAPRAASGEAPAPPAAP